jgi:hypothetical protein
MVPIELRNGTGPWTESMCAYHHRALKGNKITGKMIAYPLFPSGYHSFV